MPLNAFKKQKLSSTERRDQVIKQGAVDTTSVPLRMNCMQELCL